MSLATLGWKPYYQQQLSLNEWDECLPGRVLEQHKSHLEIALESGSVKLEMSHQLPNMTVGDWLLLTKDLQFHSLLDRQSIIQRKAPGSDLKYQLIAANIDTMFITSSLNRDFSLNRIERYLVLARESEIEPVVLLTKADLCDEPEAYVAKVQQLEPGLVVEPLNGLDVNSAAVLQHWCKPGSTLAFLGSSGVGKSTLINTLMQSQAQSTGVISDTSERGRHTTTTRSLKFMPSGALLMDTPGIRELQLSDCESGIEATFSDVIALALNCRFSDCQHIHEPGCAVQKALQHGTLDQRRFDNYLKLNKEQAFHSATLAERKAHDRSLGRLYKRVQSEATQKKHR